jgi:hypothetical protein
MSTIVEDVVREVLDRLRPGTASGNRLIAPVDSDVPGSKLLLYGPHGRSMTSAVACRHVSRVCLFGRRCSPSRPEQSPRLGPVPSRQPSRALSKPTESVD